MLYILWKISPSETILKIYLSLKDASCEELIEITHEDTAWKEVSDKTYYAPVINLEKYKAKFEKQYKGLIKVMEI